MSTSVSAIALALDHPLARQEKFTLADLRDEPVIGPHADLPEEVMRLWNVDPRPGGSSPRLGPAANTPEECLLHVNAGRGIWPAPASTADHFTPPSWPGGPRRRGADYSRPGVVADRTSPDPSATDLTEPVTPPRDVAAGVGAGARVVTPACRFGARRRDDRPGATAARAGTAAEVRDRR
ncbi:LysR substrate-binding domain-containing protein [Streptomyces nigra]|uniref:LysR substrate-binding domain-containing protein n=1 Tax=Streptomyces nigra TaxID=1827580 RepID=UPI00380CEB8A